MLQGWSIDAATKHGCAPSPWAHTQDAVIRTPNTPVPDPAEGPGRGRLFGLGVRGVERLLQCRLQLLRGHFHALVRIRTAGLFTPLAATLVVM